MRKRNFEQSRNFNIISNGNARAEDAIKASSVGYTPPVDFAKIRIGAQTLDDAILNLGELRKVNPNLADKQTVLRAITNYDLKTMREISDFFYKTSGIYARILRYMAFMYCYDWYVTPFVNDDSFKKDKVLEGFYKCLMTLDNFGAKKVLGEIALKVLRFGAYYGYKIQQGDRIVLQELPVNYCRSRYFYGDKPAVEFNMKFFDDTFRDTEQRMRVLKLFPKEFAKGYMLYKQGKLKPETTGDSEGWYLLDVKSTVKFTGNGEDYPMFISVIPLILDLDQAQDLDKRRTMQRLLKIVIQQMPIDKNGDLIFDPEEAQQLHNNAVQMLGKAIGVDVLTTFADVSVESLTETNVSSAQSDDLQRVERQVYNEAGVSQMQFNTDGNIALEKSILNDAATMYNLILQFEAFLNELIEKYNNKPKKVEFRVQILKTTIYNYQELSKLYKEQTQLGYSKMLPQVALGQSQSSVLANAYFENDYLDLINVFIPPVMSSTMNGDMLKNKGGGDNNNDSKSNSGDKKQIAPKDEKTAGRKELDNDKKSEKTIKNRESMN